MATATREEALYWCVNMDCDFKKPVYNPPGGWMWAENPDKSLVLIPVFTLTDVGNDITFDEVEKFRLTIPKFLNQQEAEKWVSYNKADVGKEGTLPPPGWYFVKDKEEKLWLYPVPANHDDTKNIQIN